MIHIATVHWNSDKWIEIQLKYIKKYISEPFKIYAFFIGINRYPLNEYHYSKTEEIGDHADKLNYLAHEITTSAEDSDLIIFLDGDAFPVQKIVPFIKDHINKHRLIAIKRTENDDDPQPHPSFCATTVGFWKGINGDWRKGYQWKNLQGENVTDVGGNLLNLLELNHIDWLPLLRSNKKNLHPLWFGVYGNMIYHHGAGFRSPLSRIDLKILKENPYHALRQILLRYRVIKEIVKWIEKKFHCNPEEALIRRNAKLSASIFNKIKINESFYLDFL